MAAWGLVPPVVCGRQASRPFDWGLGTPACFLKCHPLAPVLHTADNPAEPREIELGTLAA